VFKSDDRGNSWQVISPDLTRQLDRNQLKVMGEIQSPDVVMKNKSTTIFGNIVALDESAKNESLLYAGTDDGLIHVTADAGGTWSKKDNFPGIPAMTYVNMLLTSQHDEATVFAVFNNHKKGDFKPYILKSTDKGNGWVSIAGDLPERGSVYAVAEDHVNPNLLFAGTEFGVYFTINGGVNWVQLSSGLPTVAVRDIAIQERENDLVLASFGRSFYVLDDYSPLRTITEEMLEKEASIFPIKTALQYIESNPLGLSGTGSQGASFYAANNPKFGAAFTYYVKENPKSPEDLRREAEKKVKEDGGSITYPKQEDFVNEDNYEDGYHLFIIKDAVGNEIDRIKTASKTGVNRFYWNMRYPSTSPIKLEQSKVGRYSSRDEGPMVLPGEYSVELYRSENGSFSKLVEATPFKIKALDNSSLARQTEANIVFKKELAELKRQIWAGSKRIGEQEKKLSYVKVAIEQYPGADLNWMDEVKKQEVVIHDLKIKLWGDWHKSARDIETKTGTGDRVSTVVYQCWYSTSDPTTTQKDQYKIAKEEYVAIKTKIDKLAADVKVIESKLNDKGIPYTPERPNFKED
jgi:photosystem II stability/assembly factor-like uncharacterized protein